MGMASFLMKKRWVPGSSQKDTAKSPDDPKDASVSSLHRRDRLANPQRNYHHDDDDDDDDPLLGSTPGDATRRTPPRFRLRAMTTTTSNSGNKGIDIPCPPPSRSSNGTTTSTESQPMRSTTTTTTTTTSTFIMDKVQSLLTVNKRDIPTTTSSNNKVLITSRSTRATNHDEDEPTTIPLDFQSLDDDDDDDDGDYDDTQRNHHPIETTLLSEELDASQDRLVTGHEPWIDSMEQEWHPRHSFSTVNSDIFLNMSQDVSAYTLAIRFQDVIQLDVSNESS